MPADERQRAAEALRVLGTGQVEVKGRLPWSSNATFVAEVCLDGVVIPAVYKPGRGERPLWDFPDGLFYREVAAYHLSEALRWHLVPETVLRDDAPLGPGSLQRFVDADFSEHYFTLLDRERHLDTLRAIATFDLVANNADRKGGHCLLDRDGRVWAIDHGLCFAIGPKLRTVIWDFAGEPIPDRLLSDLDRVARGEMADALVGTLTAEEIGAVAARAEVVVNAGRFPSPHPDRRPYPWPLV